MPGGSARHPGTAAAPAEDDRCRGISLTQQRFTSRGGHRDERRVQLRCGGGRATSGNAVRLLDEPDGQPGIDGDGSDPKQIGRGDPAAGAVAEQQQTGRAPRSG
jgi:hypothetical protein